MSVHGMEQLVNHASDLCDGIIRVVRRLHAFIPTDSHAHMGGLDHPNIIGTIPNGEGDGLYPLLNHVYYLRLLQRRHSVREEGETMIILIFPEETAVVYI